MSEINYLNDTWYSRDLPVLIETVRRIDAGKRLPTCASIGQALGFDPSATEAAFAALARRGLVDTMGSFGQKHQNVTDISGEAYVLTGAHPSGETALRELLRQLADAERRAAPEEKGKLVKARAALTEVGRGVLIDVMAGVIRGQIPM